MDKKENRIEIWVMNLKKIDIKIICLKGVYRIKSQI